MTSRPRALTPGQVRRLQALRTMSQLLDSAFRIPGTSYRIGLDPIVGLVPAIGDLVSPIFAIAMLWQARDLGLPRVVQLRMLMNVGIDAVLGSVPIVGDIFDFAWKANARNYALVEQHAIEVRRPSGGDYLFVVALILGMLVLAAIPVAAIWWIVRALSG